MRKEADVCWRGGQNTGKKQKKPKLKHGIRETACANPIFQQGDGGMDAAGIPTGWIRLGHKGLVPRHRSGADQLHLYYKSEMDNLLVLAGHFNGPPLDQPLIPEEPLLL